MTKEEMQNEINRLAEKVGELRIKADACERAEARQGELEIELARIKGEHDIYKKAMSARVKELQIRLDVLTMTPEQIELILKIKNKQWINKDEYNAQLNPLGIRSNSREF